MCVALAALTTVAAGVVAGRLPGGGAGALTAGTWAGLTSGAVMTVGLVAIQIGHLDLLGSRPDYQRELAASGGTDMATYLVADAVAGSVSHMVINPGLGLAGAAIGWAISRGLR